MNEKEQIEEIKKILDDYFYNTYTKKLLPYYLKEIAKIVGYSLAD